METPRPLTRLKAPHRRKTPFAARWWFLIVGLFLWAGCVPAGQNLAPPAATTSTPWVPPTVAASPTATPPPTATPLPTASPTPAASPTPTQPACWQEGGKIRSAELPSKFLPYPMPVLVYLPPCYDLQPLRHYPVLYLIHGQNFNERQWVNLGATRVADRLIAAGEAPPFIIVMPGERSWEEPADTGWDEAFLQVLMPWVESNFRTFHDRRYRAVGGLSRGAAWAIHFGLSRWDLFGSIGGHSPPVFWEDVPYVKTWLARIPDGQWPRIYLDIGRGDQAQILSSAHWFEDLLTQNNYPHEWHLNLGLHNEDYWRAHTEEYIRWYAAGWPQTTP